MNPIERAVKHKHKFLDFYEIFNFIGHSSNEQPHDLDIVFIKFEILKEFAFITFSVFWK